MRLTLRLQDRWPRDTRQQMEPVQELVAATEPTKCPICRALPPFEHLKDAHLCHACGHAFQVDEQGGLIKWWATNKSRPV